MDISRVLTRVADGDREAFADVVEAFQRPLFGFLGRMGLAPAEAAEIAQETFVRAWRNLDQYDPARAEFSTWLFSIARNIALNELTKASRKREAAMGTAAARAVSEQSPAVDQIAREQSGERLRMALNELPLIDRTGAYCALSVGGTMSAVLILPASWMMFALVTTLFLTLAVCIYGFVEAAHGAQTARLRAPVVANGRALYARVRCYGPHHPAAHHFVCATASDGIVSRSVIQHGTDADAWRLPLRGQALQLPELQRGRATG